MSNNIWSLQIIKLLIKVIIEPQVITPGLRDFSLLRWILDT
jgi:hypothetical protein